MSASTAPPTTTVASSDAHVQALIHVFPQLVDEFVQHITKECAAPVDMQQRLRRMFEYNIIGGKYWRATLVTNTVQVLCKWKNLDVHQYWDKALVLGWAIEVLQAMFLVADDIMDKSITRRGKPCWYLQPDVQFDAVNDSFILESFMFSLLRTHLHSHPRYADIVHLYQTVSLYTQMGQMYDLTSQPQGRKDPAMLAAFSLELYERIVTYKTALYTFYLPLAAGMMLIGMHEESDLLLAKQISIELGKKFQIEDDYLDCYGLPEEIGKIGTDIRDYKCSWLVVQALKRATPEQRALIESAYGHEERENEIKQLYKEMNLQAVFDEQEDCSYALIESLVKNAEHKLPSSMFLPILAKIHKRRK